MERENIFCFIVITLFVTAIKLTKSSSFRHEPAEPRLQGWRGLSEGGFSVHAAHFDKPVEHG
ncbi:MAG: hypothetical protein WCI11_06255 [Candidatus Methylumidiphilus sp.]